MSSMILALSYLRRRWGQALLSTLVGALGIAAVTTALSGFDALPAAAERSWGGVDIVVGPKSAALDLVLCCALHVANPQGLVSEDTAMAAVRHPLVRAAAPIALGDNVDGLRIVGTTPEILSVYRADLAGGRVWTAGKPLEAVLGAQAARRLKLKIGDHFVGVHGLVAGGEVHAQFPYAVVGVLESTGSVLDRLVLTDVATVRYIHQHHHHHHHGDEAEGHHEEHDAHEEHEDHDEDEKHEAQIPNAVTAVVASFNSPVAAALMPRLVDASPTLAAASPSLEIARVMSYLRPLTVAAMIIGGLLMAIAALGASAGLMASMNASTRDLALLRALGAGKLRLASVALCQASTIAIAATVCGLGLSVLLLTVGGNMIAARTGLLLAAHIAPMDAVIVLLGALIAAVLAALVPALRAMHASIEELLEA
jgi:putative ABC transport system permease protein